MLKKLLALLLLVVSPAAFGQVVTDYSIPTNVPNVILNPSMNDCQPGPPTCGAWKENNGFAPGNWTNGSVDGTPGKVYQFSFVSNKLYQEVDLSSYQTNSFNFYFDFDLNNSCRNSIGGYCENVNGPIDEFSARIKFYDTAGLFTDLTFLDGRPSTARIECKMGFQIFGICILGSEALPNWEHFGYYSSVESQHLFTSLTVEFTGRDVGFWGGLYGPQVDNATLSINYLPPPPVYPYWNPVSQEYQTFTLQEQTTVRYGAEGGYAYQTLQPGTYECGNGQFGRDPIGGVVKECAVGSNQPPPSASNCSVDPTNPDCKIKVLTDPVLIASSLTDSVVASASSSSTDEEDDDVSSDTVSTASVDTTTPTASATTEVVANTSNPIESFSAVEKTAEPTAVSSTSTASTNSDPVAAAATTATVAAAIASSPASQAAYRELTAEEKAAILADAIAKNTIENALAIAGTAASSSLNNGGSSDGSTSTVTVARASSSSDSGSDVNGPAGLDNNQTAQNDSQDSSSTGMELLDTGRSMGQQALSNILAASQDAANQAGQQAESIAQNSTAASIQIDFTYKPPEQEQFVVEVPVFSQEVQTVEQYVAETINTAVDTSMAGFDSIFTDDGRPKDLPGLAVASQVEQETLALLDIIRASSIPTVEDESSKQFEEVNIANTFDPNNPALNMQQNVMNLEILGIIKPPEEKSDAEKASDKVVAANKEQQDEINKNYMEADQSGIVAAIGADTDVSSYKTAMIADAAQWYKDKDIYKGVIIKDNVRGSYFLEKGSTDTYKKMVDEQYK